MKQEIFALPFVTQRKELTGGQNALQGEEFFRPFIQMEGAPWKINLHGLDNFFKSQIHILFWAFLGSDDPDLDSPD